MSNQRGWQDIAWIVFEALAVTVAIIILYVFMSIGDARADTSQTDLEIHAARMEIEYNLPTGLVRAICEQETHWRNVAGQHGEIGVCQLKPETVLMICDCSDSAGRVFLGRGATGDAVRQIQAQLARWGLYTKVDGVYGPGTRASVIAFQKALGTTPDGVVGPNTWALLFRGYEPYPGNTIAAALWNPHKNIEWAAAYLSWLRDNVSGDPAILIAAYNGGPANPVVRYLASVQRRMARGSM